MAADASSDESSRRTALVAACLPIASFVGQFILSLRAGTLPVMLHHPTVMAADWVFVPFNYFVIRTIDWRRGGRLFLIACVSISLNVTGHAFWQYRHLDPGHMITASGATLPAGWIHLAFATVEAILLIAFVFCRKVDAAGIVAGTVLAVVYFLGMALSSYYMHQSFNLSDVSVSCSGLFFVLIYPRLMGRTQLRV